MYFTNNALKERIQPQKKCQFLYGKSLNWKLGFSIINTNGVKEVRPLYIYIRFLKPKFRENLIRIKIRFCFFNFPYKLNCLNFCCYFFSRLISIFFILFLLRYFVCQIFNVTTCNWTDQSHAPIPIQFRRYYLTNLLFYFVLYLVEFHVQ